MPHNCTAPRTGSRGGNRTLIRPPPKQKSLQRRGRKNVKLEFDSPILLSDDILNPPPVDLILDPTPVLPGPDPGSAPSPI